MNVPWSYRERLPLFVPRRYYVPARTFLYVPDRLGIFHERFCVFKTPFMARKTQKRSWNGQKQRGTLNAQEQLGTIRNVCKTTFTFTFQKRKNYCNQLLKALKFWSSANFIFSNGMLKSEPCLFFLESQTL